MVVHSKIAESLKMTDLKTFTQGLIFLHGLSGAGKGELKSRIEKVAEINGTKFFYLASGDCFRAIDKKITLSKTDSENYKLNEEEKAVAQQMAEGKQIPGLQTIAPPVIDMFLEYIDAIAHGEKAVMVFDGFLRNGEDTFRDGEEEIRLPSQILQVGEMIYRSLKSYYYTTEYDKKMTQNLIERGQLDMAFIADLVLRDDVNYKEVVDENFLADVVESIRKDSSHAIVDVLPEDAEILMRYRSAKAIKGLALNLHNRPLVDDRVEKVCQDLLELYKLQTGRIYMEDGKIKLQSINSEDNSFKPFGVNKGFATLVDAKLGEIAQNICEHLGVDKLDKKGKPKQIKDVLKDLKQELSISDDVELPRADDLPHLTRITRIKEYFDKAKKGVIECELGIHINYYDEDRKRVDLDHTSSRVSPERVRVVVNGPTRGIGYDEYINEASKASLNLYYQSVGVEGGRVPLER